MAVAAKVWLVTGASSAFGRAVAENALQQGDSVVAVLYEPGDLSDLVSRHPSRLVVLSLDVRVPSQAQAAFDTAFERFGRVDVVFNNAGNCIIGEAEGVTEEQGRDLFETLFWGAVNVSREAVRTFRDRNSPPGGRLLQASSSTALKAVAGVAHYGAAKAAFEGFTLGMSVELDPKWNIRISVIQPALFRTTSAQVNAVHLAYSDCNLPSRETRNLHPGEWPAHGHDGDLKKFAQAIYRLAYKADPPFYLPLHRVALEAAKGKGEELIQAVEQYASWSDDVYFGQN